LPAGPYAGWNFALDASSMLQREIIAVVHLAPDDSIRGQVAMPAADRSCKPLLLRVISVPIALCGALPSRLDEVSRLTSTMLQRKKVIRKIKPAYA
jgi:hypothetical protein